MMKNKFAIFIVFAMLLAFIQTEASADIIDPDNKTIMYCYKISNLDDYPDYVFLYYAIPMPNYQVAKPDECPHFYKLSTISVYAIDKDNFDEDELNDMTDAELDDFFNNDPRVMGSGLELKASKVLPKNDPVKGITIVLKIHSTSKSMSISSGFVEIIKSKIIYTFTDGTTEELEFYDQDIEPQPYRKPWFFYVFWFLILPMVALTFIVLVIWSRKSRD